MLYQCRQWIHKKWGWIYHKIYLSENAFIRHMLQNYGQNKVWEDCIYTSKWAIYTFYFGLNLYFFIWGFSILWYLIKPPRSTASDSHPHETFSRQTVEHWDNLWERRGSSMVNGAPRRFPRVLNVLPIIFYDMWHLTRDTLHVTPDKWHLTHDMWHLTYDTWWGVNILSKFQLPSSYGLGVMMIRRFVGKGSLTESMNEWIY